eukprot:TRINITY_DN4829_c0_g2_i1.p1 TRINITY_DN4829_c0_g2~~TRINITY_DN4829_c0_g2_i1.p1  ORF type:complete len:397 (-),score=72.72 TRINITY_DN4829_c0_g2_i1:498-1688(-)
MPNAALGPTFTPAKPQPPGQALDFVVVSLITAALIPFVAGNIYIVLNRSFLPIKSKSVDLTVLSSVGGFIWIFATFVTNGHFEREGSTFWTICSLWSFWLQLCFGFALWLGCLIVRLACLRRIFITRKNPPRCVYYLLLLYLSPVIAFCAVASIDKASVFAYRNQGDCDPPAVIPPAGSTCKPIDTRTGDCLIFSWWWAVGAMCVLPIYFCVFLWQAFRLRNIMAQYNEFQVVMTGGVLSLFLFLLSLVTIQTYAYLQVTGRCFLTLSVAAAIFYYFWARMGGALYDAIFRREAAHNEFLEEMQAHSMQRGSLGHHPVTAQCTKAFEVVELLLQSAWEDCDGLRERVHKLEERNRGLTEELSALKAQQAESNATSIDVPEEKQPSSKWWLFSRGAH